MNMWLLLLISSLSNFVEVVSAISLISLFVAAIFFVLFSIVRIDEGDVDKKFKPAWEASKRMIIILCCLVGVCSLIPTQKAIHKAITLSYVTNIEDIEKLPDNSVKALNKMLEEYIESDE